MSGIGTSYSYNNSGKLTGVYPATYVNDTDTYATTTGTESVEYTYNAHNRLAQIIIESTRYMLLYDDFGNQSSIKAGNNTLATYEYEERNGKLKKITYGNGLIVRYVYNDLENLSEIWYTDGEDPAIKAYEYEYTANGLIQSVKDNLSVKQTVFTYDKRNQLSKIVSNLDDDMYNDLFTNASYYCTGNSNTREQFESKICIFD